MTTTEFGDVYQNRKLEEGLMWFVAKVANEFLGRQAEQKNCCKRKKQRIFGRGKKRVKNERTS
jgi:glycine cleavage system aminomethyltransferase T